MSNFDLLCFARRRNPANVVELRVVFAPQSQVVAAIEECQKIMLKEDKMWTRSYRFEPKEKSENKDKD